jgi:hypothetical protein
VCFPELASSRHASGNSASTKYVCKGKLIDDRLGRFTGGCREEGVIMELNEKTENERVLYGFWLSPYMALVAASAPETALAAPAHAA